MESDDFKAIIGLLIVVGMIFLTLFGIHDVLLTASHNYLGAKGGPCFPNMTCREGLKCVKYDGIKPTCVK